MIETFDIQYSNNVLKVVSYEFLEKLTLKYAESASPEEFINKKSILNKGKEEAMLLFCIEKAIVTVLYEDGVPVFSHFTCEELGVLDRLNEIIGIKEGQHRGQLP